MKLYATIKANKLQNGQNITVEKGQGSNEWLDIKLTITEGKTIHEIGIIRLQHHPEGYELVIDRSSNFRLKAGRVYEEIINTKGKKKKGDSCKYCGITHDKYELCPLDIPR